MDVKTPSPTASGAAMLRLAHLLVDDDPKIFRDEWANFFLDDRRRDLANDLATVNSDIVRASRSTVTSRAAYTESELEAFLDEGGSQYVLLGAGYDSYALRHRDDGREVTIYEVDHPATQQFKRQRLANGEISDPDNVRFVPVDFERQDVATELTKAGWQRNRPTFFSWLGVTMYLTDAATFATLELAATCARGSCIAFQYSVTGRTVQKADLDIRDRASAGMALGAEPWINFYEPEVLMSRLEATGFDTIEDLRAEQMQARFFAGRTDGLWWPTTSGMAIARV